MLRTAGRISAAGLMAGAMALGGCATTGQVKRAQDAADQAMAAAQAGQAAAQRAQSSADSANAAAQRAQSSADAANSAAQAAAGQAQSTSARVDELDTRMHAMETRHRTVRRHVRHHRRHHSSAAKSGSTANPPGTAGERG